MKSIIIGAGEIGKSLYRVLQNYYPTTLAEKVSIKEHFDVLHICFPFSDKFISEVKKYQKQYKPKYTIIHSTVPIGTNRKLSSISSPIIGIHPFLQESIKTFTKFLGGEQANEVADYFRRAGIKVQICKKPETTEMAKLSSTTLYALIIEYVKNLNKQCEKYDVPFSEVYTLWSQNYNKGYKELGFPEYVRPILQPIMKKQGGHCTLPNCKLWDTVFTKFINKLTK